LPRSDTKHKTNKNLTIMEKRMCGCGLRPKTKEERNLELRKDAARIVEGVENYSAADRTRKAAEVEAAFPPVKAAPAKKPAAGKAAIAKKPAAATGAAARKGSVAKAVSPGPTLAGLSTGSHSGDVC
jgi:nucleoid-associated protein YgaU